MSRKKLVCAIPDDDPTSLALRGFALDKIAAAKLETTLKKDPSNMTARIMLLAYHMKNSFRAKSSRSKHLRIVLWMIENCPEHTIVGTPFARIERSLNPRGYEQCKRMWLRKTRRSNSVSVLTNAAASLRASLRLAEALYRRALLLKPNDSSIYRDLAFLLYIGAPKKSDRIRRAFVAQQQAVRKERDPQLKRYLLDDLAEMAFDLGEWSTARRVAQKSVDQAYRFRDWSSGNAIHDGNMILGRLALRNGARREALDYLKRASKTPGSPQLNSFGPKMVLAQELLNLGERRAVIAYLKACKKFWDGQSAKLDSCIRQIESGETPILNRFRM